MRAGHLFAGIDGLGLGLERHGFDTVWFSENEDAPSRVLAHHYPDIPNHGDITTIDWTTVEPVDVLTGGFPCQDLSYAGKGAGIKEGTRSGLWFEYVRAIRALSRRLPTPRTRDHKGPYGEGGRMMWDLAGCRVDSPTVERLTSWLSDELGRDVDVWDLFFPPSSHHPESDLLTETALLLCNGCPIRFDCADWAVRTHQLDGIHGGMRRPEKIVRARQLGIRIRRERMGLYDEEAA